MTPSEWQSIAGRLELSGRERQVLEALCDGLQDAAIGRRLRMSVNTLRSHYSRLHNKLGVHGRVNLVLAVFRTFRGLQRVGGNGEAKAPEIEVLERRLTHVRH